MKDVASNRGVKNVSHSPVEGLLFKKHMYSLRFTSDWIVLFSSLVQLIFLNQFIKLFIKSWLFLS